MDLNSDLGENVPDRVVSDDEAMLDIVSSANVSCGFHAGSPEGIKATLQVALSRGVTLGAHPGYRDYEGFGRRVMDVDSATIQAHIEYQLGAIMALATSAGGRIAYVKPHGALYNTMANDVGLARDVAAAVKAVDPALTVLALAGSIGAEAIADTGLRVCAEAFADRAYTPEGHLVDRSQPGAVLHDAADVAARMVRLATDSHIQAIDGSLVRINAQSICVHGDSAGAVAMARATREQLEAHDVAIAPFVSAA